MKYSIISACTREGGIGFHNQIPWKIPGEMILFKKITSQTKDKEKMNAVIMGRKTWETLKDTPLVNRVNIVITSEPNKISQSLYVKAFNNINDALLYCEMSFHIEKVFIIGGEQLYNLCLQNLISHPLQEIHLSVLRKHYGCDRYINLKYILQHFQYNMKDIVFTDEFIYIKFINK